METGDIHEFTYKEGSESNHSKETAQAWEPLREVMPRFFPENSLGGKLLGENVWKDLLDRKRTDKAVINILGTKLITLGEIKGVRLPHPLNRESTTTLKDIFKWQMDDDVFNKIKEHKVIQATRKEFKKKLLVLPDMRLLSDIFGLTDLDWLESPAMEDSLRSAMALALEESLIFMENKVPLSDEQKKLLKEYYGLDSGVGETDLQVLKDRHHMQGNLEHIRGLLEKSRRRLQKSTNLTSFIKDFHLA